MLTPHHLKSFTVPLSIRPLTPAVTLSRVSTIHKHHYDVDMVAERCVHIDDFLVTGPEPNVERFLEQARGKLNMQDAVRLYKTGDEGRLLAMNLRKLDNGYSLQGKPLLIHRIATTLGMENAKTSPIPETINEKAQDGDEESLTPSEARNFRTCVGKAMYLSHHRPDIQHSVNTLSRSMRNPTVIAMRRLKKLTRYLLGTSEVYQELCPDPHAETLQVPVDSDWAGDRKTRQSCSGGAVLFHGCAVLTWARTQKTRALSSAEAELYGIGSGAIEGLGAAQLLREWQYKTVPLLQTDSQSALAVCKRTGSNETYRAEDACSAGMAENGTTSNPQSIDSRQSGRPHDQSHESRETDQVRTSVELARSILHRLEPPCTVTSDWCNRQSITEILTVEMNTVNSFQYHRLRKRGKTWYNDDEDRDRHVTTAFHLKQFGNPQNVSANVAGMMAGTSSSASVCEQSFHEGGNRE